MTVSLKSYSVSGQTSFNPSSSEAIVRSFALKNVWFDYLWLSCRHTRENHVRYRRGLTLWLSKVEFQTDMAL